MVEKEYWTQATGENSPLTRSFWMGRYLQLVEDRACIHHTEAADGSPDDAQLPCCRTELARCSLNQQATSLSPNVFKLVVHSISSFQSPNKQYDCQLLLSDCTLNWPAVNAFMKQRVSIVDNDYTSGGRRCAELAVLVHREITHRALYNELGKKERFTWIHSPEVFVSLVKDVSSGDLVNSHTSILKGTAALERALGDVYVSVSGGSHCPLLLRDLLCAPELRQVLGQTAVFVLACLIGPPTGLNLRNILWHGFVAPSELPLQYSVFLIVLVASLGSLLSAQRILPLSFRPYLTLTHDPQLSATFKGLELEDCDVLKELISSSFFILSTMVPLWVAAVDAHAGGRYAQCLVLLLPALEHSLRRVFACVNNCSQRVLTAELTTLYTTFDEILSPLLPTGEPNRLIAEIGTRKMEMLLDLLVHSEGPRVRDRISHNEVDFSQLTNVLANHILCLSMLFCAQYCLNKELLETPLVRSLLTIESGYVSLFHPLSLLKQELLQLLVSLSDWAGIPKPESLTTTAGPNTADSISPDTVLTALSRVKLNGAYCTDDGSSDVVECVRGAVWAMWSRDVSTLFMERRDLELVGVVRRTVGNAQRAVSQIHETATMKYCQYRDKQLRSRQRPNYQHLISSLPLYLCSMSLLVALSLASVSHIPLTNGHTDKLIRYQKKLLQLSENAYSQSSKNRWEEVDKLCHSLEELAISFPTEQPVS